MQLDIICDIIINIDYKFGEYKCKIIKLFLYFRVVEGLT